MFFESFFEELEIQIFIFVIYTNVIISYFKIRNVRYSRQSDYISFI